MGLYVCQSWWNRVAIVKVNHSASCGGYFHWGMVRRSGHHLATIRPWLKHRSGAVHTVCGHFWKYPSIHNGVEQSEFIIAVAMVLENDDFWRVEVEKAKKRRTHRCWVREWIARCETARVTPCTPCKKNWRWVDPWKDDLKNSQKLSIDNKIIYLILFHTNIVGKW